MQVVIGLFDEDKEAQSAAQSLRENGYDSDITILHSGDETSAQQMMTQANIPSQDVSFYTEGLRDGGSLVIVRTDNDRARAAADIMSRFNMVDIDTRLTDYQTKGKQGVGLTQLDENGTVIPVVEEEIQVGKRQVQRGGVRIHTTVTEKPVEEQVTLREEHVHVDRRPVDRAVTDADMAAFKEGSFELTETAEEAVVAKQARVVEEVVVGKEASERTETVRDTVRRTDVDVEQIPGQTVTTGTTTMTGTTGTTSTSSFDTYNTDFQNYYNKNLSNSG